MSDKVGRIDLGPQQDADGVMNRFDPSAYARGGIIRVNPLPPLVVGCCLNGVLTSESKDELPKCPFCSTTLKPERVDAERFVCPCCSRVFPARPSKV